MKKILSLAVLAAITLTGCKKDSPVDPVDPHATFKADATPRWENGPAVEENEQGAHVFVTDGGGKLFDSDRYKTGRMSADGSDYELIEFSGAPAEGHPANPALRTPAGVEPLHRLEIVQASGGMLWIVFQETAGSPERRIVQ